MQCYNMAARGGGADLSSYPCSVTMAARGGADLSQKVEGLNIVHR